MSLPSLYERKDIKRGYSPSERITEHSEIMQQYDKLYLDNFWSQGYYPLTLYGIMPRKEGTALTYLKLTSRLSNLLPVLQSTQDQL